MASVNELRSKLRASLDRVQSKLGAITAEQMELPATWRQQTVNVRFTFYRLIAHEVEHTVHMVKTLSALGFAQSEAQLVLHRLQAAQGELEGLVVSLCDEDLDRAPGEGEWSPRQVLEHVIEVHEMLTQRILEALG